MAAASTILLKYQGNWLVVDPTTDRIRELLQPILTATEKRFVYGPELRQREALVAQNQIPGPANIVFKRLPLYYNEIKGRLTTLRGLYDVVTRRLVSAGYRVRMLNLEPASVQQRKSKALEVDFGRVYRFAELRYKQRDVLIEMGCRFCGRIGCPPGYGKSFLIVLACKFFPSARIHIVVKSHALLHQTFDMLMSAGCNPGMEGHGRHQVDKYRVTVISADSLHRSPGNCDLLLVDECLTGDTPVDTPDGPRPIALLTAGSSVLTQTDDGVRPGRVSRHWCSGEKDIVEVLFVSGKRLRCTRNHPLATRDGWVAAGALQPGSEVVSLAPADADSLSRQTDGAIAVVSPGGTRGEAEHEQSPNGRHSTQRSWLRCLSVLAVAGSRFVRTKVRLLSSLFAQGGPSQLRVGCADTQFVPTGGGYRRLLWNNKPSWGHCWVTAAFFSLTPPAALLALWQITVTSSVRGSSTSQSSCRDSVVVWATSIMLATASSLCVCTLAVFRAWQTSGSLAIPKGERGSRLGGSTPSEASGWLGGFATTARCLAAGYTCILPDFRGRSNRSSVIGSVSSAEPRSGGAGEGIITSTCVPQLSGLSCLSSNTGSRLAWSTSYDRVVSVLPCGRACVYDITVDDTHCFFANGLLVHNCHEMGAAKYSEQLARYDDCSIFGFSGSQDKRSDGRDLLVEAICGPLIVDIKFEEARKQGVVNDISVLWTAVRMKHNPAITNGRKLKSVAKLRSCVWRNGYRNSLIAKDARRYGKDVQVLITTDTIDHAVRLKRRLPEYELVYSQSGMERIKNPRETIRDYLIRKQLLPDDEPLMTAERALALKRQFEAGTLKKVIATTVWNVGVDFKGLSVLIRADGGSSAIRDTQIPGRTSRIQQDKPVSIVHDYWDEFDVGMRGRSLKRRKNYKDNGYTQMYAPAPDQPTLFS